MTDARFAISMHILTLLATNPEERFSSEVLAGSVKVNPVTIRKELAVLKKAGLVASKEGPKGGASLARPATQILLSDVYAAVSGGPLLGLSKNEPNPECFVGRQINRRLQSMYLQMETAILDVLGSTSLRDFLERFE